jgi:hypothetical protein
LAGAGAEHLMLREPATRFGMSELKPQIVVRSSRVDELEYLLKDRGCDGLRIKPVHLQGRFEEFARAIVQKLQLGGVFRASNSGRMLCDAIDVWTAPPSARVVPS